MKNYQVVILDLDGVILESVGIKDDAFKALFKDFPQHLSAIMNYHLSHDALNRYAKFRYIYEEILGVPYTTEVAARVGQEFSRMIFDKIVSCPFVDGAPEFLQEFSKRSLLYLISLNPAEELKSILAAREIKHYFADIYPHPWGIADAVRDILRRNDFYASDAVLIGSTPDDLKAAHMTGVNFIGREGSRLWAEQKCMVFKDLTEIAKYLSITNESVK